MTEIWPLTSTYDSKKKQKQVTLPKTFPKLRGRSLTLRSAETRPKQPIAKLAKFTKFILIAIFRRENIIAKVFWKYIVWYT